MEDRDQREELESEQGSGWAGSWGLHVEFGPQEEEDNGELLEGLGYKKYKIKNTEMYFEKVPVAAG